MTEKYYPEAVITDKEESIDSVAMGREAIQLLQSGSEAGYYGPADPGGTPLSDKEIAGIIQHGKNAPMTAKRIVKEVFAERDRCRKILPSAHDTVTKFKATLKSEMTYGDETVWYNKLLEKHDVSTYTDLKAIYDTQKETVVAEK